METSKSKKLLVFFHNVYIISENNKFVYKNKVIHYANDEH